MTNETLFRLSGVSAIIGGLIRATTPFLTGVLDAHNLHLIYLINDVFILFGMMGIYLYQSKSLCRPGLVGFVAVVIGLLIVRSQGQILFGIEAYRLGASLVSLGLTTLSVAMLLCRERRLPRWIAIAWIGCFVSGVAGLMLGVEPLKALAGVLFGVGLAGGGVGLVRAHQQ